MTSGQQIPSLGHVLDVVRRDDAFAQWSRCVETDAPSDARVSEPILPVLLAALWRQREQQSGPASVSSLLLLAPDDATAERICEAVGWYLGVDRTAAYVARGVPYGGGVAPAAVRVGMRAAATDVARRGGVVVASLAAIVERVPPVDMRTEPVVLRRGDVADRDEVVSSLVAIGYERVEQVEERGQLSVRGDIVDLFATTWVRPVRIEFFDVEIEEIRSFSTWTQRSHGQVDEIVAMPATEVQGIDDNLAEDALEDPVVLASGGRMEVALDAFFSECRLLVTSPAAVQRELEETMAELDATSAHVARDAYLVSWELQPRLEGAVHLDSLAAGQSHRFEGEPPVFGALGFAEAESDLAGLASRGVRVVVTFPHAAQAQRTADRIRRMDVRLLGEAAFDQVRGESRPAMSYTIDADAGAWFAVSDAATGFVSRQFGIAVVPSGRLFRRRIDRDKAGEAARAMSAFTHLGVGDYVVHEDHGVGQFLGFETRTVAGVTRDYLLLAFQGEDRLYVPHEQMGKVTRYVGADASKPTLSKLGGKRWANLKNRARTSVRELAGELLALYALRARARGHAYPEDDEIVSRFEAAFPFTETEDQLIAITAVKEDLERPQPMDRLLCGDVGFGKTEVAMRAAVKVVSGGRQVMFLVPTTVLAQQHLASFHDRIGELPIEVDMVSRFRSKKETTGILDRFRDGRVDILIGTHRLLGRDVQPRDLGLVVLDEEQRFGVAQKEFLRKMRLEVDVLAMSATPIPRTLHMSLAGLRDISIIETPPRGRQPIHTHVGEYDEELVRMAVEREIERDGQVFYLHNRVETIDETAARIHQIVPKARIVVGHGQMAERELERVMLGFMRRDFDVLVATTIIEAGLDIPSANTLIVERADVLGLSQLHQIRGRVGRSEVSAHAYLFYPSARELTEEARARLTTLSDFTDLGAGSRIAMRDLELRGAGNLLGADQSGHVAAIGFELYVEMLAHTVAELAGEPIPVERVATIDVRIDAYVPADYVASEAVKIDLHRRMALARSEHDLAELVRELEDRFGDVPDPVRNLLSLSSLRLAINRVRADRLSVSGNVITIAPVDLDTDAQVRLRTVEPLVAFSVTRGEVKARIADPARGVERALALLGHIAEAMEA